MQRPWAYYDMKAKTASALANPARLAIVDELAAGERSAGELVRALSLPQPQVSQHLAVLRAAGLVSVKRRGSLRIYGLSNPAIARACGLMGDALLQINEREAAALRLPPLSRG